MKRCLVCNKKLREHNQSKFCSRECYYISNNGIKRPDTGKKIAATLKGQRHTQQRKNNISISKKKNINKKWDILTSEDILKIEAVLEEGYSSELKNIMIASEVNKNYRSLYYYIQRNIEWYNSFNVIKYNPTEVQQWNINKWKQFKADIELITINELCIVYNLLERKLISLCKRNNLSLPIKNCKSTYFSQISQKLFWEVYNYLPRELKDDTYFAELNGELRHKLYKKSREGLNIKNKEYSFDFCIIHNNILFVIEFNGDIFHANPMFYIDDDCPNPFYPKLTSKEIWERDQRREDYVLSLNGILIPIWEYDYHNHKQEVLDLLQMYINMVFYNSENKTLRSF